MLNRTVYHSAPASSSYRDTDKLLQSYGISLAPGFMAQSAGEAVSAAEKLGYPCVLKVASVDIPHKTEFGALRLGLENRAAVEKAYEEMLINVRMKKPDARIEGVLVQKQIKGVECLLGIDRDEQLGPTLVMGLGGVFVEILADVQIRIPPISAAEAKRALESLKGAKVFTGVRGAAGGRPRRSGRHGRQALLACPRSAGMRSPSST